MKQQIHHYRKGVIRQMTHQAEKRNTRFTHSPKSHKQTLILKAALSYFVIVFITGCLLGTIRVLYGVPQFGLRAAELIEMPFMLIAMVSAAYLTIQKMSIPSTLWARLEMGLMALMFLLLAEFGAVLQLRGLSFADYLANRDPISGTIYYIMLFVFVAVPCFISQKEERPRQSF